MSLRTRLLAAMLGLFVVGLVAVDFVTYLAVQHFLLDQVDSQLDQARIPANAELTPNRPSNNPNGQGGQNGPSGLPPARPPAFLPPGTYIQLRGADGAVLSSKSFGFGDELYAAPRLPASYSVLTTDGTVPTSRRFTVSADDGSADFRVLAAPTQGGNGTVIVALPLTGVDDTLAQLRLIELGVTGLAGLAVLVLAWWLIHRGLRPLQRMVDVAGAISEGDLSRRLEPGSPRTEVGRLAGAFNHMLGRIQESFEARLASEERLRRFVSDASHELRTPLTSIRGYAELFGRGTSRPPEDMQRAMERIDEQALRMSALVEDLLLLARLDEHQPLEHEPVDLAAIAGDAVADAEVADGSRRYELSAAPVVVSGDERRLRQVLANLLTNERVHTPAGTNVAVRVASSNGTAVLEVEDNGPGFRDGEGEKIFERFYRGDSSRSRERGGSGLGLSIVASIVQAHGGRVMAKNREGGGCHIEIQLPLQTPG